MISPEGQEIISLVAQGKWRETFGNPTDIDTAHLTHLRLCDKFSDCIEVVDALNQAMAMATTELESNKPNPFFKEDTTYPVPGFMRWIAVVLVSSPVQLLAVACTALLIWYRNNLVLTISVIILALITALASQKRSPHSDSWYWIVILILLCGGFSVSAVFILGRFTHLLTWARIVLGILAGLGLTLFPGLSLHQAMIERLRRLNFWTGLGVFCMLFMITFGVADMLLAKKPFTEIISSAFYYIQENDWALWGFKIVLALILGVYFARLYGIQKWDSESAPHFCFSLTVTLLTILMATELFFHVPFIVGNIGKLGEISGPFAKYLGGFLLYYGVAGVMNIPMYVIFSSIVNAIARNRKWSLTSRIIVGTSLFLISVSLLGWLTPIPESPPRYFLATSSEPPEAGSINLGISKGIFDREEQVTLTAEPASGYVFEEWGGNIDGNANPVTVTMVFDRKLIAYFRSATLPTPTAEPVPAPTTSPTTPAIQPKHILTIMVNPPGGGSIVPSGGIFDEGAQVTLTAKPNSGYKFDHWGGDVVGNNNTITFTMDVDKRAFAYFEALSP